MCLLRVFHTAAYPAKNMTTSALSRESSPVFHSKFTSSPMWAPDTSRWVSTRCALGTSRSPVTDRMLVTLIGLIGTDRIRSGCSSKDAPCSTWSCRPCRLRVSSGYSKSALQVLPDLVVPALLQRRFQISEDREQGLVVDVTGNFSKVRFPNGRVVKRCRVHVLGNLGPHLCGLWAGQDQPLLSLDFAHKKAE